ncbi:hypothetical protein JCM10914A_11070 [Paenibacillus sp. JCM 10914]|uniref:hypothetical protein n=1 Tax=Paenibacillus sp. JCM 10914 TaxID=1236974 RepID=UPI0003CC9844|nr:hypothetical protein [Paenibacillus sp. JCM 10914]GAE08148.1 hypothetical protein JCM10914_4414 [Paenibacillus sp. JCM 10914]
MSFIDAIKRYQESGDADTLKMIRKAMNYDYLHSPTGMTFDKPEMYVAFRCLRLLRGRLATIKYTLSDYGLSAREDSPEYVFAELTAFVHANTGVKVSLQNFKEHETFLREYLVPGYLELEDVYMQLMGERETLWQQITSEIIDKHWSTLEKALKDALDRVDTNRSEREIIRYINYVTRTAYYRHQFEGMRRVRRGGEVKYVKPKYFGPHYAIFGKISVDFTNFSGRQRQLIERIIAAVETDYAEGRIEDYTVDMNGGYRIVNRHIAEQLGMHEVSLSRSLKKIKSVKH